MSTYGNASSTDAVRRHHAAGAVLHRPRALRARDGAHPLRHVALRGTHGADAAPGRYFLRQVGNASVIVLRGDERHACPRSTTCAATAARACARRGGPARRPHPVLVPRLDLRARRPAADRTTHGEGRRASAKRTTRSARATAVWDGHVFINLSERPRPFAEHLAGLPGKFAPWGMERAEARGAPRLPAEGELEAHHPELLGVPPLPDRAPAAEPAVALHERGQRAAPADVPGRAHGPARRGQDAAPGRAERAGAACRACAEDDRRRVYYYAILPNLLLNLHPDYMLTFTTVAAGGRTAPTSSASGTSTRTQIARPDFDPTGAIEFWDLTNRQDWELSELGPGGNLVARLSARAPTRTGRSCCRPSIASSSSGRARATAARAFGYDKALRKSPRAWPSSTVCDADLAGKIRIRRSARRACARSRPRSRIASRRSRPRTRIRWCGGPPCAGSPSPTCWRGSPPQMRTPASARRRRRRSCPSPSDPTKAGPGRRRRR